MKIVFSAVSKHYGPIIALKEINFEITEGEFVFLVGPSGAGKSTILKLILNQIRPSTGEITVGEFNINHKTRPRAEKIRKNIGVIFQDYQLIPDKTVEENISLALDIINYPSKERPVRIEEVLTQVGLLQRRHLFPAQLSGGELQRSALARALSIKPKLILADEPTGNLDPENSWNLIRLLKDINNNGTTILMTTHNYDIINSLDKRIITIENGGIIKDDHPAKGEAVPDNVTSKVTKKKKKKVKK
ncbi:ATP-binding cassette domain-containing protein [Patescibacteria group bacterium]|nr:ATP-binding cassette domain-containing protein [Patescibacteria group bacterium]